MEKTKKINDGLTLHIDGIASNGGDVDLSVFVNKLDSLRLALQESDKHLLGMNKSSVDFFVTDLNHSSPSAITIGIKPSDNILEYQSDVFNYFSNLVANITSGTYRPASANYKTLDKLTELATGIGDKFSSMWFTRNNETVAVVNFETLSALNDLLSKKAFNGIRISIAFNVFALAMAYNIMTGELFTNSDINLCFISHQICINCYLRQ